MRLLKNKKSKYIVFVTIIIVSFLLIHIVQAVMAEPGTDNDPLVSQSYVDAKVNTLTTTINSLSQQVQTMQQQLQASQTQIQTLQQTQASQKQTALYETIQVKAGQQLTAGASTEIILRSGKATAVASQSGGVSDLISGQDIKTGETIPLNHLLLVPRDDGRGLKAATDMWILIKGSYTIK